VDARQSLGIRRRRYQVETSLVCVFEVVEVTPHGKLNAVTRDDLAAQDRVAVVVDTGCMVSR
jgi:hypothetical protein